MWLDRRGKTTRWRPEEEDRSLDGAFESDLVEGALAVYTSWEKAAFSSAPVQSIRERPPTERGVAYELPNVRRVDALERLQGSLAKPCQAKVASRYPTCSRQTNVLTGLNTVH